MRTEIPALAMAEIGEQREGQNRQKAAGRPGESDRPVDHKP